jgi:2-C-methyl-D-erythritol 4-phosphate cytidylyltransferase
MKVVAIIPAGGTGRRMGGALSKQYLVLGGIHMLAHTIGIFQRMEQIERIVLIVPAKDIDFVKTTVIEGYGYSKVGDVLAGGEERQDSVRNGLFALGQEVDDDDIIVIHDAVRPLVTEDLILRVIDECRKQGAAVLGVPVKDTVKSIFPEGIIKSTLERRGIWLAQTPQVFKKGIITEAYRRAYEDGLYGTDDAVLVERIGIDVKMVLGSYDNIKITTPEDLKYAEWIFKTRMTT